MSFLWDNRLARMFGICYMAGEDDPPGGGGGGGEDDPPGGGGDPDWKAEAEKWRALSRKHEDDAKKNREAAARLKDLEDKNKSELEKAQEKAAAADREAAQLRLEVSRSRVALKKGLTEAQAKRLQGATEEELEADADELLKLLKPEESNPGNRRLPQERMRPGSLPNADPEETDPRKLAAAALRR